MRHQPRAFFLLSFTVCFDIRKSGSDWERYTILGFFLEKGEISREKQDPRNHRERST